MFIYQRAKDMHTHQGGNVADRRDGYGRHVVELSVPFLRCSCRWALAINRTGSDHNCTVCLETCLLSEYIMNFCIYLHEQESDCAGVPTINCLGLSDHPHKGKRGSLKPGR